MTNLLAHTTVVCAVPLGPPKGLFHQNKYILLPWITFGAYPRIVDTIPPWAIVLRGIGPRKAALRGNVGVPIRIGAPATLDGVTQ